MTKELGWKGTDLPVIDQKERVTIKGHSDTGGNPQEFKKYNQVRIAWPINLIVRDITVTMIFGGCGIQK